MEKLSDLETKYQKLATEYSKVQLLLRFQNVLLSKLCFR